ncbi:hypothetical protein HPSNAG_1604 [Glaesserella parasuis str. Nagasaki]|nr:hypothetical protein HPSNAG_1604 [Glaesserella parasuis str. Nagasaki]
MQSNNVLENPCNTQKNNKIHKKFVKRSWQHQQKMLELHAL